MAKKEVYSLDITIGVNGDKEAKKKIKDTEEITEKAKKKFKDLDKVTASPTARLRDQLTSPLTKLESKINSFAAAATKRLIAFGTAASVALGGIGAVSTVKTFANWEASMSNVKALTGATTDELNKLAEKSKDLGARTSKTAKEAADAMGYQALAGWNVNQIMSSTEPILRLSEAANSDLAHTSDLVTDSMSAMGVQTEQLGRYLDIVAQTQASANTTADGMLEAYIGAGGMFKSFNTPLEESAALLGVLANRGIKGSEAGTSLNSILINLMGTTKRTSAALQQLGVKAYDEHGNFRGVETTLRDVKDAMVGLTDEQEDMLSANLGGKTQIDTLKALLSGLGEEYDTLKEKVTNSDGALNRMAETMQDNLKGQWTRLKSAIEGAQIDLGEKLAPYMKQFVTWFTNKIPDIKEGILSFVDYVSKNTDKLLALGKAAVTVTGSIMALSLVSKTLGAINGVTGFVSSVRAIQTGAEAATSSLSLAGLAAKALPLLFSPVGLAITAGVAATAYGVHEYNKLMDESILTAKEDLDPIEQLMDSMSGNMHKSKAKLKELGLIYDDFGEGVSDSFKSAAKDASKSLLNIEMDINRLTRNGKLDEGGISIFKNYVNDFAYEGINAMKEQKEKIENEFNKTFMLDGVLNETEKNVTKSLSEYFQTGIDKQMQIREDIYGILNEAFVDHSKDLDTAMKEIKDKLAEMKSLELEYTKANNAYDQAYAQNQFKRDATKVVGLEDASELLKSRAEDHNKQLDEIDNNYKGTLAYYDSLLSNENLNETERADFEKGKEEAQKARDEALKQIQDNWTSDLETFYKECSPAKDENGRKLLNEDTGAIFSKPELKSQDTMSKIQNSHSQLEGVTTSGVYTLQNDVTKNLDTLYVSIDEKTGEIKGLLNGTTGEVGAYSDEQKEKLMSLQEQYSNTGAAMFELAENHIMLNTTSDEVISKTGDVVGQLENVQTAADGTVTGILNINGTPIQITSNADGTIISMNDVTSAINAIPKSVTISISTIAASVAEGGADVVSNAASQIAGSISQHADGTDYATSGLSTVNERGWELSDRTVSVIGQYDNNPLVNLQSGTKIRSHMDSMNDMRAAVKEEVSKQVPQGTYQVAQAPVQVAGIRGLSFGDTNININGNQDVEAMIQQAMIQFGNTLRSAFSNIKK